MSDQPFTPVANARLQALAGRVFEGLPMTEAEMQEWAALVDAWQRAYLEDARREVAARRAKGGGA